VGVVFNCPAEATQFTSVYRPALTVPIDSPSSTNNNPLAVSLAGAEAIGKATSRPNGFFLAVARVVVGSWVGIIAEY